MKRFLLHFILENFAKKTCLRIIADFSCNVTKIFTFGCSFVERRFCRETGEDERPWKEKGKGE